MDIKGIATGLSSYLNTTVGASDTREVDDQSVNKTAAKQAPATGDVVTISDTAKMQALATREATQAPDIRRAKVEEVKAKIQSGQYKPDSRKIAEGIVKNDLGLLVSKG